MSTNVADRDPLYLFACHLEWRGRGNLAAYEDLLAALDDSDCDLRTVAEVLLAEARQHVGQVGEVLKHDEAAK
jgi:hypothetical protein